MRWVSSSSSRECADGCDDLGVGCGQDRAVQFDECFHHHGRGAFVAIDKGVGFGDPEGVGGGQVREIGWGVAVAVFIAGTVERAGQCSGVAQAVGAAVFRNLRVVDGVHGGRFDKNDCRWLGQRLASSRRALRRRFMTRRATVIWRLKLGSNGVTR